MLLQVRELKVNLKNQLESPGDFLQDLQEKTVFFDGLMLGSKTAKIFIQLTSCSPIENPVGAGSPTILNAANSLNKPAPTPQKPPIDIARNRVSENGARYQIQGTYQKYPEVVKVVSAGRGIGAVQLRVKEGAGWKGEELIKKDSSTYSTLRMLVARPIALGSASNYFCPSSANNKKSGLANL